MTGIRHMNQKDHGLVPGRINAAGKHLTSLSITFLFFQRRRRRRFLTNVPEENRHSFHGLDLQNTD